MASTTGHVTKAIEVLETASNKVLDVLNNLKQYSMTARLVTSLLLANQELHKSSLTQAIPPPRVVHLTTLVRDFLVDTFPSVNNTQALCSNLFKAISSLFRVLGISDERLEWLRALKAPLIMWIEDQDGLVEEALCNQLVRCYTYAHFS